MSSSGGDSILRESKPLGKVFDLVDDQETLEPSSQPALDPPVLPRSSHGDGSISRLNEPELPHQGKERFLASPCFCLQASPPDPLTNSVSCHLPLMAGPATLLGTHAMSAWD